MKPHLEVVPAVAVRVLGRVQEDEQVLPQVPGQGGEPGPAGGGQGQMQHFRRETSRRLDELQSRKGSQSCMERIQQTRSLHLSLGGCWRLGGS